MNEDNILGAIFASAAGDALGAAYEGGILEKAAWKVLGTRHGKYRWTDDTQMSIDIMESLMSCRAVSQDDIARRFAASYDATLGYGPGAARILKKIQSGTHWSEATRLVYPDGSFGNGAAMRVAPIGLYFHDEDPVVIARAAAKTAEITHVHPLGIEGAALMAVAVAAAFRGASSLEIVDGLLLHLSQKELKARVKVMAAWLHRDTPQQTQQVQQALGNGVAAHMSAVTAVYCALAHRHLSFTELLLYIRNLGGDVDTIGAMAGAVWGAAAGKGSVPDEITGSIDNFAHLADVAQRFASMICSKKITQ
ncbi:MAG: ADP-ribosylglycohydrolase family protein [Deltaproteobacteria bacterium]|nr:ADP-ribosylglycohydrolase family protein [Deltaproteobacteria bacterium]MBN2670273.1 ADP-ribosylglycohydrolase family protein [Deltaproteobacteria bacterium]